jgi:hypothetical protein
MRKLATGPALCRTSLGVLPLARRLQTVPQPMNEPNRRIQPRVCLSVPGKVRGSGILTSALDSSLSGLALITDERRSPGTFLRVAWCIPGHGSVEGDAVVVHARMEHHEHSP